MAEQDPWNPAEAPGIVLHFQWREPGTTCQETYGPWPADDEVNGKVSDFVNEWRRLKGLTPTSVTMALVQDPAASLAELEAAARERQ